MQMRAAGVVVMFAAAFFVGGCTSTAESVTNTSTSPSAAPVDPLVDLRDPRSPDHLSALPEPLLHEQATGSQTFTVERPESWVEELHVYVSCSKDSHFTVTLGTYFSGPCNTHFLNSGSIPLPSGSDPLRVAIKVPAGVRYWIIGLPVRHTS